MELILGMMKVVNMMDGVTLWMEVIPWEIISGIVGRLKALLYKAHCGDGVEVIMGSGITVRL